MSSLETSLQIHEFSREFLDVTRKDGKFVSGGFGASEIANKTYAVPDKIKEAVNRGYLRINDNYPPKEQEFALLAKEIDEYAILAVATGEHDDKNRPLIAYRYFWLAKPQDNDSNNDTDGIGTLILWWHESNQPKFNFQNNFKSNNLQYRVYAYKKAEVYNIINHNFGAIPTDNIAEIKLYPHIALSNLNETNSYLKLHYLALHLHKEFKTPLSWAWNVGILEKPKSFTIIWAVNQDICSQITIELKKYQKSLKSKNISDKDIKQENNLDNFKANDLEESLNQPIKSSQNLEYMLKQLILNASADIYNESHFLEIILFLNKYSIHEYEKDNVIDIVKLNSTNHSHVPVKEAVMYRAILILLGFDDLYEWTQWLNSMSIHEYEKDSFKVQKLIVDLSFKKQYFNASNQLIRLIFHNYSNLLLKFLKLNYDSKEYKFIEWLLLESKSIWHYYFKLYTQNLVKNLIFQDSSLLYLNNEFYQQIFTDLSKYETYRQQNFKKVFDKYKSLSLLFRKIGNNSLSGLFYQLSEGAVPKEIYYRTDVQIIPLARKQTIHPVRKIGSFIRENGLIITISLFIFVGVTGITWLLTTKNLPQWQQNSSNR